ncbi:hypothetical protein NE237_022960 [Protea cynaroides]|uniref:Uncharacterized protein n=1 Tax=Protea cynaroides TaxID=273540 RepID=A0A9Q0HAJ9_9MAGN|nr:hypothetical protein NE237_022960 [Protea cynaroides]
MSFAGGSWPSALGIWAAGKGRGYGRGTFGGMFSPGSMMEDHGLDREGSSRAYPLGMSLEGNQKAFTWPGNVEQMQIADQVENPSGSAVTVSHSMETAGLRDGSVPSVPSAATSSQLPVPITIEISNHVGPSYSAGRTQQMLLRGTLPLSHPSAEVGLQLGGVAVQLPSALSQGAPTTGSAMLDDPFIERRVVDLGPLLGFPSENHALPNLGKQSNTTKSSVRDGVPTNLGSRRNSRKRHKGSSREKGKRPVSSSNPPRVVHLGVSNSASSYGNMPSGLGVGSAIPD